MKSADLRNRYVMSETSCSRTAVLEAEAPFARPIQEHALFLWEELDGMARGSGIALAQLLVLQARAEVMRANKTAAPPVPECTTFAITGPRAGGATLFGQNVDLVPFVEEFGIVVR
jgi:hypothetical protein